MFTSIDNEDWDPAYGKKNATLVTLSRYFNNSQSSLITYNPW